MTQQPSPVSPGFQAFAAAAPGHAQAWSAMVQGLAAASALEKKTAALAYLAVKIDGCKAEKSKFVFPSRASFLRDEDFNFQETR